VHSTEAARRAGININTAKKIRTRVSAFLVECEEAGLPTPTIKEQVARKPGSGAKPQTSAQEITNLLKSCTLNKKQRKKLWHVVAKEDRFFDYHRRTIKKKLRERGLRRAKSTKKLGLMDIQEAQRYKVALSRKDLGLAE
jgi:hypothetical protein